MMPEFRLACPERVDEVLQCLAEIEGEVAFLSGGTDLLLQLNEGRRQPAWLVDLSRIRELDYILSQGESIRIGGMTTFSTLAENSLIKEKARCLAQAAAQIGSTQIRNRATLAGNIAGASAAGDSLPALLVFEAWVSILGPSGRRSIPFAQFQSAPGQTLQRGEFIVEIELPLSGTTKDSNVLSAFGKIGSRRTVTVARLNMAVLLELEAGNGLVRAAKLALGALGRTPFRLAEIEREVCGRKLDQALAREVALRLSGVVDEAIPGRDSQAYKRQAIQGLAADVLADLTRQLPRQNGGRSEP